MAGDDDDDCSIPGGEIPDYDPTSTFYTMKLWHSGRVVIMDSHLSYWGGQCEFVDYCDYDKTSIVELDAVVMEKLKFSVGAVYYVITRLVEVYCSHPINEAIQQDDGEVDESEPEGEAVDPDFRDSDYEQSDAQDNVDEEVEKNLEGLLRRNKGKGINIDLEDDFNVEDYDSDIDQGFAKKNLRDSSDSEDYEEVQHSTTRKRPAKKKLPTLPEFIPASDMKNPTFQLGLVFPSGEIFKQAIRAYAVNSGKAVYFKRNEPTRVRAACSKKSGGCPWLCFASKVQGSADFVVKTLVDEHKCKREPGNMFASASWLANTYADLLKSRKGWDVNEFISQVKKDYIVDISVQKAYRARRIAERLMEGSYSEQYEALWDYAEEIKLTNPGSTVKFKTSLGKDGCPQFLRIYICYSACKEGFKSGCRKLVGLDGCHLKGPHKGQLLSAIAIDANNSMFPVAFAVVEAECKDSWSWFLEILRADLGIDNHYHWSFISDKQKGLEQSLKEMWVSVEELAEHRHCARHVQSNFTKSFKGHSLKLKMMAAAMSTTVAGFKVVMEDIKKENEKAYEWLMSKGPSHWCKAYFRTDLKCDILLNNLCESFNGTTSILSARERPILSLLERIRMYILQRHTRQRLASTKWHLSIGPRIAKIIERGKVEAAFNVAYWCGERKYQVVDKGGQPYKVDLEKNSCSCNKWDLSGIPCCHSIACIWHNHEDPELYVNECYRKDTYDRAYAYLMMPIRRQDEWPESQQVGLKPPAFRKQPGRPKKSRRLEHDEVYTAGRTKLKPVYNQNHCKVCGNTGHNSRTCPNRASTSQTPRGTSATASNLGTAPVCTNTSPTKFKTRARRQVLKRVKKAMASKNVARDSQVVNDEGTQASQMT